MDDDIAIKVEHIYKNFKLPHEKTNSLKSIFTGITKKKQKGYEVQHALKDISFEVKKGEFFGIVGRNGSGKSTLLKIIAEIYQPTKGKLHKSGKLVPFIELGVGFNPELTGRENVYLNGALLGFTKSEIDAHYQGIVEFSELERFMDQKLKNYSSGMQVRLAFSVATRAKAEILLVDEVLAVGDADFQRKCFNYFSELKRSGTTVIFISHDMSAVREYCDRAMLIEKSSVVEIGTTHKIADRYLKLFMGGQSDGRTGKDSEDRWGDKSVVIEAVKARVLDDTIRIDVIVKANKSFVEPVLGLRVRDASGAEVTGTNTKQENVRLSDLRNGQTTTYSWSFPNVLRDGSYVVDTALQYKDAISVADWWNASTSLSIKKARRLPYMIDPGFSFREN